MSQLRIVSSADERFVPHFATMLHSAWVYHPGAAFYLLDCGIEPGTIANLKAFATSREIQLTIINVDTASFRDLPTNRVPSVAAYGRLFIPDLFPSSIERVLYLDADCLIVSDLTALWRLDMGSAAIAAAHDAAAAREERADQSYVNSGVMLINLDVWRRDRIVSAAIAFIKQHQPRFQDQAAINAVCVGKIALIESDWNFMLGQGIKLERLPRIIHCAGAMKWWLHRDAPFADVYCYHRNQTPFPMERPGLYRSSLRTFVNLLLGRRKYRDRRALIQNCAGFSADLLSNISRR